MSRVCLRDHKPLEATLQELSPFVDAFISDNFDSKTSASGATARRTTGVETGDQTDDPGRRTDGGERQASDSFGAPVKACAFPARLKFLARGAAFTD